MVTMEEVLVDDVLSEGVAIIEKRANSESFSEFLKQNDEDFIQELEMSEADRKGYGTHVNWNDLQVDEVEINVFAQYTAENWYLMAVKMLDDSNGLSSFQKTDEFLDFLRVTGFLYKELFLPNFSVVDYNVKFTPDVEKYLDGQTSNEYAFPDVLMEKAKGVVTPRKLTDYLYSVYDPDKHAFVSDLETFEIDSIDLFNASIDAISENEASDFLTMTDYANSNEFLAFILDNGEEYLTFN